VSGALSCKRLLFRTDDSGFHLTTRWDCFTVNICAVEVDVANRASIEAAAEKVKAELGHIDILINNAGYLETFTPIADSDPDDWWSTWEINVKETYLVTRSILSLLLESNDKTIIQLSSVGAHITSPGGSAYQGTKSPLLRLNNFIMAEYGGLGILAYGIHPGVVMAKLGSNLSKEMHEAVLIDKPELVGDTVVWLTKEKRG
jgi:NADP-dependent 3-hydroxy acid dehydrogenase YdfG